MHNDGIVSPLSPFASSQRTHGQVFDTKVTPSGRLSSGGNSNLNNSKFISGGEIGNSSVHSPQRSVSSRSQQQSYVSSSSVYSSEHWLIHFRAEMQKAMDSRADAAAAAKDVGSHQNHSGQGGRSGQSGCMRMLSFNETLELIGKFYESKKLLNSKCGGNPHQQQIRNVSAAGAAVPVFETMEQHVYHSYEKKYGLRTLALEHCSMFVSALELYSSSECITRYNCPLYSSVDIRVFYKIFRNELDENFHEIHQQLNKSIRDLIVLHIMNRYPNKTQEAVQELLDKKMNGIINNEEWTDIVNYLYNGNDARSVLLQLKIAAQEEHDTTTAAVRAGSATTPPAGSPHLLKGSMTAAEREKEARRLGYARGAVGTGNDKKKLNASSYATPEKRSCLKMSVTTFLFTVFSFQLASHEMYLTKFVRVFHKHDSNGDGVVTTEEFWRCFLDIRGVTEVAAGPVEEGMFAQLLEGLDPNKTGIVTFTSAAEALSQFATASAAM